METNGFLPDDLKLFNRIISEIQEELIEWKEVHLRKNIDLLLNKTIDVDFLSFHTSGSTIAQNKFVSQLLGAGIAKIYTKCMKTRIRCNISLNAYVFARIGDFSIGLLAQYSHSEVSGTITTAAIPFDIFSAVETIDDGDSNLIEQAGPITSNYIRSMINSKLERQRQKNLTLTCRECLNFINEQFNNERIIIFRYGQKQPIFELKDILLQLAKIGQLDIAIGYEISKDDVFLSSSFLNFSNINKKIKFFSNFGSFKAANVVMSGIQECSEFISGAYRIIIYNTFQHSKKAFSDRKLPLNENLPTTLSPSNNYNLHSIIEDSVVEYFSLIESQLLPSLYSTKLRIEVYVTIYNEEALLLIKNQLNHFIATQVQILEARNADVFKGLVLCGKFIKMILQKLAWKLSFSSYYIILELFSNYHTCLFSKNLMIASFLEKFISPYKLNSNLFLIEGSVETSTLKKPLLQGSFIIENAGALSSKYSFYFQSRASNYSTCIGYILSSYELYSKHVVTLEAENYIKLCASFLCLTLKTSFEKLKNAKINISPLSTDFSLIDLLHCLYRSSQEKALKWLLILLINVQNNNMMFFKKILHEFEYFSFQIGKFDFVFDSIYQNFTLTQTSVLSFLQSSKIEEMELSLNNYSIGLPGKYDAKICSYFLKFMNDSEKFAYKMACKYELLASQISLVTPLKFTDFDMFLRFFYGSVSINVLDDFSRRFLLEYFRTMDDFTIFLSYGLLVTYNNISSENRMKIQKNKDNFSRKLITFNNEESYHLSQLLFATGNFKISKSTSTTSTFGKQIPKRMKITEELSYATRYPLIRVSNFLNKNQANLLNTTQTTDSNITNFDGLESFITETLADENPNFPENSHLAAIYDISIINPKDVSILSDMGILNNFITSR